jgi:beta-ribofuranosylaminobenzene 5'-phosphate synthase
MSEADAARLCHLILMKALPALAEHDLASFGAAITELQNRLGDYFAPVQGGARFMSPDVAAVLNVLDGAGAFGVGQSSWGPTGFAFAPNPDEAERMAMIARRHPNARALDIRVCQGLNRGAEIIAHAHASEFGQ